MAQQKDSKTGKWMYYGSYLNYHGERIQYKKRGFATKKDARKAEDIYREQIINPIKHMTFRILCDEYLVVAKKTLKSSSLNDTKDVFRRLCKDIGELQISDINENILQDYIDKLDEKYTKQYVEKLYYKINVVLDYAVSKEYISKNPLKKVHTNTRKDEIQTSMCFWEPNDFNEFIKVVDSELYFTLFSFLYYMGVRKGEALALTWKDIDFKERSVKITKNVATRLNNKITTPKTSNSIRTISMSKKLTDIMIKWKAHEDTIYDFSDDCFVFGTIKPLSAETIRRNFNTYIKKANENLNDDEQIPKIRIHDLRHSHASYLINNMSAGFTDFDIAKRLGDTVSTLHSTYAHWFKSADKNIIDFMDNDI